MRMFGKAGKAAAVAAIAALALTACGRSDSGSSSSTAGGEAFPKDSLIGVALPQKTSENWVLAEKLFNDRMTELLPESSDFKFELAQSGFEAGTLAQSFHPDSIIIDLGLGRSESIQITANLRKNDSYTSTLIIGLAGEDEAEPEKLKEYGFDDVFKKPFDVALLGEKIRSIAEAKRED